MGSADEGMDDYFRKREQMGLLTPVCSPDLMQRGSLYDPDQSGGSSSNLSQPTLASSSSPKDDAESALASSVSPNSAGLSAGPISPVLLGQLSAEVISPPPCRQLDFLVEGRMAFAAQALEHQ